MGRRTGKQRAGDSLSGGRSSLHRVLAVRRLTESAFVLRVEREGFPAVAGQCCTVGVVGSGVNREYSLYSGGEDPWFEFLVREVEDGLVSPALGALRPGDEVELDGPYGRFVLARPEDRSRRYLFIASGVGIAPFHGFVRSHPELDYRLIHGVRFRRERYEHDHYAPGRYLSCLSREDGGDFQGRVTAYLRQAELPPGVICYICGNSAMVGETFAILRERGVDGDRLFTEVFF